MKYLKIFFKAGAFFGCAMGMFYAFQRNSIYAGVGGGLAAGILFGATMVLLTYMSDRKLKKAGSTQAVVMYGILVLLR
ncbi:MAG: hypothetical protein M3Z35_03185 [Nitrospirota bacterium]|nr:hypothetical protein [Nitrospirota bacterium]